MHRTKGSPRTAQVNTAQYTPPDLPTLSELPEGVLRARWLVERGISRTQIKNLTDSGQLLHLGRGLYSRPDSSATENHDLAQLAARVPQGVVCLASALQFHQLTTQNPWRVHLMIPRGARPPQLDHPPILLFSATGDSFSEGIEEHQVEGVTVRVTSVAKTVADCFKYRSKVGLDVALEALQEALREHRATRAQIRAFAKICRVENVIKPYLEAMSFSAL
jgi:predicted transcriptional regulator of viral defense system